MLSLARICTKLFQPVRLLERSSSSQPTVWEEEEPTLASGGIDGEGIPASFTNFVSPLNIILLGIPPSFTNYSNLFYYDV